MSSVTEAPSGVQPGSAAAGSADGLAGAAPVPGRRALAWLLLAAFALLMGWVLSVGQAYHQPRPIEIDWGQARWLTLQNDQPKLFLRRVFIVGGETRAATISVAAAEQFEVLVNGVQIGREDVIATHPVATFDVTRILRPGRNVIAIEVTRNSKRLGTQAMVRMDWIEGGRAHRLVSDAQWRAESRLQADAGGNVRWPALGFDDTRWPRALEINPGEVDLRPQPDGLSPALLSPRPDLRWIWHSDPQTGAAAFRRDLHLAAPAIRQAWLGVSVDGTYSLAVNGTALGPFSGTDRRMDVLDIAPYLQRGDNRIEVQVSGGRPPMRLATLGRVVTADGLVDFGSDESWQLSPGANRVTLLAGPDGQPPALAVLRVAASQSWTREWLQRWLGWSAAVGAAVLALALWSLQAAPPAARARLWMRAAQPWAAGALLLAGALIAHQDPRLHLEPMMGFWLPVAACALVALVAVLSPVRDAEAA